MIHQLLFPLKGILFLLLCWRRVPISSHPRHGIAIGGQCFVGRRHIAWIQGLQTRFGVGGRPIRESMNQFNQWNQFVLGVAVKLIGYKKEDFGSRLALLHAKVNMPRQSSESASACGIIRHVGRRRRFGHVSASLIQQCLQALRVVANQINELSHQTLLQEHTRGLNKSTIGTGCAFRSRRSRLFFWRNRHATLVHVQEGGERSAAFAPIEIARWDVVLFGLVQERKGFFFRQSQFIGEKQDLLNEFVGQLRFFVFVEWIARRWKLDHALLLEFIAFVHVGLFLFPERIDFLEQLHGGRLETLVMADLLVQT